MGVCFVFLGGVLVFQKKAKLAEEETEAQKGGAQQQSREQTRAHETAAKRKARKASTAHSAKHRKRQITRRSAVQSKADQPTHLHWLFGL